MEELCEQQFLANVLAGADCDVKSAISTYESFLVAFNKLREATRWAYAADRDTAGIPFDDACKAMNRDPDEVAERLFRDVPETLLRAAMGGKNYKCPICRAKH